MNGCSKSISAKPVFRPVAEAVYQCELLDECICLFSLIELGTSCSPCAVFTLPICLTFSELHPDRPLSNRNSEILNVAWLDERLGLAGANQEIEPTNDVTFQSQSSLASWLAVNNDRHRCETAKIDRLE
jgi:hypothetical protein